MRACVAGDSGEAGSLDPDGQTVELAARLRALAAADPELARTLVSELVAGVDRATGGAFAARLSESTRTALGLDAG